jgi:urease accessory protein
MIITIPTIMTMTGTETAMAEHACLDPALDSAGLYRLMAWLSPSFPVGAFSHSHALEWVVETGEVGDVAALTGWVEQILRYGGGRQDAILLAETWRAATAGDTERLSEVAELAAALSPSKERAVETLSQGRAFALAAEASWPADGDALPSGDLAYPVAVGIAAARHKIPLVPTLAAYLHAFVANIVSAGIRLVPLGQTDGQKAIAALEPVVASVTDEAMTAGLDDLGGCVLLADIASMRHETQYTRLFRT